VLLVKVRNENKYVDVQKITVFSVVEVSSQWHVTATIGGGSETLEGGFGSASAALDALAALLGADEVRDTLA
jgi:hypothetical protein